MKKLFEVQPGDSYFYCLVNDEKVVLESGTALITKVESYLTPKSEAVTYVEFEEDNSFHLHHASVGSSFSISNEDGTYFIAPEPQSLDKGVEDYFTGKFISI